VFIGPSELGPSIHEDDFSTCGPRGSPRLAKYRKHFVAPKPLRKLSEIGTRRDACFFEAALSTQSDDVQVSKILVGGRPFVR
jgi:hypothetical protein